MIKFVPITAAYAGILAVMLIALSYRVSANRQRLHVSLGDEGQDVLARAIRSQGNFVEYVPFGLLLIMLLELNGATAVVLHALGSALVVARGLHAWGLSRSAGVTFGRYYGIVITWLVLLAGGVLNLYVGFY